MKWWFDIGNKYVKNSSWKDIAVIKFCLLALGILIGTTVLEKDKKPVRIGAASVFAVTYVPLMIKLFGIIGKEDESSQ